jgi:2-oxoglutarate dehydrogenase E1 component
VMSPKSLLRHPLAASPLAAFTEGGFHAVLGDDDAAERADRVTRLVLCSGKVYVDLVGSTGEQREERAAITGREQVAIGRVEELYPFPGDEIERLVSTFPKLRELVWVQEEPRNMGAWFFVAPLLHERFPELALRYEGRPERASPAEGYAHRHQAEQNRLVTAALSRAAAPEGARRPAAGAKPARRKG